VITIWKFGLKVTDGSQTLEMPEHAEILHVADQFSIPTMWVLVDTDAEPVARQFVLHGTGHPIDLGGYRETFTPNADGSWNQSRSRSLEYVGTAVGQSLVWHVFENTDAA
jgi:hypothetical protein